MKIPKRVAVLALGLAALASVSGASLLGPAVSPQQAVRNMEGRFASLQSLEADFEQDYFSATITTPLRETGRFYFQKPGRMRWEYREPEPHVFVVKDGRIWDYTPEDNQLIRTILSPEQKNSAVFSLLTGQARIEDDYLIEGAEFPSDGKAAVQVKLVPRQEGAFAHILLEIDSGTWLIDRIVTLDWAGSKQEFVFRRVKIDPRLAAGTFEVKVPAGTEIIEDLAAPKK